MGKTKGRPQLSHLDARGAATMVDVSAKPMSAREAVAEASILLGKETLALVRKNGMKKGDVLSTARIAGIQAAKLTQQLIPLCHQIPLSKVSVDFTIGKDGIHISTMAKTISQTGVEMEALTAASVAALTIYDMCKAVDKKMRITNVRLVSKTKTALS